MYMLDIEDFFLTNNQKISLVTPKHEEIMLFYATEEMPIEMTTTPYNISKPPTILCRVTENCS